MNTFLPTLPFRVNLLPTIYKNLYSFPLSSKFHIQSVLKNKQPFRFTERVVNAAANL